MSTSIRDERFEHLRPALMRWLLRSGTLLSLAVTLTVLAYGDAPILKVSSTQRALMAVLGAVSLIGFVYTGGLLLGEYLLRRYSPAWRVKSD